MCMDACANECVKWIHSWCLVSQNGHQLAKFAFDLFRWCTDDAAEYLSSAGYYTNEARLLSAHSWLIVQSFAV